ncbi:hypothetical protein Tco_0588931 [Tanacetum coccineum]
MRYAITFQLNQVKSKVVGLPENRGGALLEINVACGGANFDTTKRANGGGTFYGSLTITYSLTIKLANTSTSTLALKMPTMSPLSLSSLLGPYPWDDLDELSALPLPRPQPCYTN